MNKFYLMLTGNELLTGDIIDSNSALIAEGCKEIGLTISKKVTLPDNLLALSNEIIQLSKEADILLINGGLGPTVDDLTAQALANAANVPLEQNSEALSHLKIWANKRNITLCDANLKQVHLPKNASIIHNKNGSAVGIQLTINKCLVIATPGVPIELNTMLFKEIIPKIKTLLHIKKATSITRLQIFGLGESSLQRLIDDNFPAWPKHIELGFRAGEPLLEIKLTTQYIKHKKQVAEIVEQLKNLLGHHIVSEVINTPKCLAEHVLNLCHQEQLTLTTAESCTGGLIASEITKVSGASQYFEAGFVTYSNKMKNKMLAVSENTIENYGAVSEETVRAMAKGALKFSEANLAVAVSGIAGPSGGSDEKPVGSVWIAWGDNQKIHSQYFCFPLARVAFQKKVALTALDLLRRFILSTEEKPSYFK